MPPPRSTRCPGHYVTRRDFLRVGSLTFLGASLPQFLAYQQRAVANVDSAKAQRCLLVWLDGGPSQMDSWDPKGNTTFASISTATAGFQISELFPRLAPWMDRLSAIRSMKTPVNNHHVAQHYALCGHRRNPAMEFPSIGSMISNELPARDDIPTHTMVSALDNRQHQHFRSQFLGAAHDPLLIRAPKANPASTVVKEGFKLTDLSLPKGITTERLENRRAFSKLVDREFRQRVELAEFQTIDEFTDQALRMIVSNRMRNAFELSKESDETQDRYGRYPFGQSMLLARRLLEAGSRFVTAAGYPTQAWDTHGDNDRIMKNDLGPTLDQTLSAALDDLQQRGLLESTVVLVMGEFGRTADVNPYAGRDHWPDCWSLLVGGGGLRGGQVIGESDDRGAYVAKRPISIGDVFATVYKAMGIDWTKEYLHPIGRPIKIANSADDETGLPIPDLF